MSPAERFLEKVRKTEGCWLWTRAKQSGGYGQFFLGKRMSAHRAAYLLFKGSIPDGLVVRHTCDTPECVNPDHLLLGTHADNAADMVTRGHYVLGRRHSGEEHHQGKLTWDDVRYIREHAESESRVALAKKFGVSDTLIHRVIRGEMWRIDGDELS